MNSLKILVLFSILFSVSFANAQNEIWQSDLRVGMTQKSSGYQIYEITMTTDNDDSSRSPVLIFTLPRNSKVRGITFEKGYEQTPYQIYGTESQALTHDPEHLDSFVSFNYPNLNKTKTRVKVSIEQVVNGWKKNDGASAYVVSLTPELNKQNNFVYLPMK